MADLNALIAQGVQFKAPPDPFAQYAQMQQLQQGEQANRLAQYQLGAAQRADVQSNALNQAYQSNMNPDTGEINYPGVYKSLAGSGAGASIPGVQQQQFKSSKEKAELAEILGRVAAQPVALAKAKLEAVDVAQKQSRDRLNRIDPYSPDAGQQLFAWHQSNHAPGILGDTLRANGSTTEQSQQEIANAVNKGPQAIADFIARSSAGQQEFAKMIAPIPKRVTNNQISFVVDENPKSPTFGQKIGGEGFAMKMTPGESARLPLEQQRAALEQERVGLEKRRVNIAEQGQAIIPPKELQKREAALPQATSAVTGFENKANSFVKDLIALRDSPGLSEITGIAAGRLPGITDAGRKAEALYNKVVAKGGFQALQDLRDASKTGGALGNVSNQEGKQLTASFSAIDRRQNAADVKLAIEQAIGDVQGASTRMREAYDSTYAYKTPAAAPAVGQPPAIVNPQFPGFSIAKP